MSSSDEEDEGGKKQWVRRPVKRGEACRTCCQKCWTGMLDTPIGPIAIVSLLVALGCMAAVWAMVNSGPFWHYPLYNTLCSLVPLIPLFCMGGADEIERIAASASSQDDTFRVDEKAYALGWFLIGASLVLPFGSPVLLGQMQVIPPHLVWISAAGSWCLVASIVLGVAFSIRLSYHTATSARE